MRNKLLSSNMRLLRILSRPSTESAARFGRKITCAIGSIVCVPHDCILMNGYRYSTPTVGIARTRLLVAGLNVVGDARLGY